MYQVMVLRPTNVVTAAKDLNISLSGLDRAEELEKNASRGTLLPFLASEPHFVSPLLLYECSWGNIAVLVLERDLKLRGIGEDLKGRTDEVCFRYVF